MTVDVCETIMGIDSEVCILHVLVGVTLEGKTGNLSMTTLYVWIGFQELFVFMCWWIMFRIVVTIITLIGIMNRVCRAGSIWMMNYHCMW